MTGNTNAAAMHQPVTVDGSRATPPSNQPQTQGALQ